MSAQPMSVNLLESENTDNAIINRLITWAVTYGRYIMIATEIVVLLAFIARFSLDRQRTDLREEISQKQAILEANQQFENEFKSAQRRLSATDMLIGKQAAVADNLSLIQSVLPPDITFQSIELNQTSFSLTAISGTTESFSSFLNTLKGLKQISQLEVSQVRKNPLLGIQFVIRGTMRTGTELQP